jgi:hypothetical protein
MTRMSTTTLRRRPGCRCRPINAECTRMTVPRGVGLDVSDRLATKKRPRHLFGDWTGSVTGQRGTPNACTSGYTNQWLSTSSADT